jgi:hypothetical protein
LSDSIEGEPDEKSIRFIWNALLLLTRAFAAARDRPIILKAATVLDGKGEIIQNTIIVIERCDLKTAEANEPLIRPKPVYYLALRNKGWPQHRAAT